MPEIPYFHNRIHAGLLNFRGIALNLFLQSGQGSRKMPVRMAPKIKFYERLESRIPGISHLLITSVVTGSFTQALFSHILLILPDNATIPGL